MIKESLAKTGKIVTTLSNFDGIGIGYLLAGFVYEPLGNGFCADAKLSPFPVVAYLCDNGDGYKEAVCKSANVVAARIRKDGTNY